MIRLKKLFRSAILQGHLQSKSSSVRKAPLLLLRHDADCGYRYQGRVYSQIIDSLVDIASHQGIESLSIAAPFSSYFGASAYNNPLIFNRTFFQVAVVGALLKRAVGQRRALIYKRTASIAAWKSILNRLQPAVVIGIQPGQYLCAACKAVGIPVYDYQHGVIAADHWWYGNVLPKEVPEDELPTGILCWDRASADALEFWAPERGVEVRVLGNPWFMRFEKQMSHDHLVQEAVGEGVIFSSDKPRILVSLQWGLGELYYADSDFNGVMCEPLSSVIKKTYQSYNWMLRLHPIQLQGSAGKQTLEYLDREFGQMDGVEWEETSRLPLPVVLTNAQLHITDMSTVVIEAAWRGVPSAILNPFVKPGERLATLFKEERMTGIASLVEQDESAIEQWILSALESGHPNQETEPEESLLGFLEETVFRGSTTQNTDY